jgi:3-hydroxyacyl-CoA dehydrogenase
MHPSSRPGQLVLGVVGAGAMGRGIAQAAAQAGVRVMAPHGDRKHQRRNAAFLLRTYMFG